VNLFQFSNDIYSFVDGSGGPYRSPRQDEMSSWPIELANRLEANTMNDQKHFDRVGTIAKAICALSLAVSCTPAWSDTGKPNYEMAFFSDSAQGTTILSGKYDQAIEKINTKVDAGRDLHMNTNLCVAYTKSGNIEEAVVAAKTFRKVRRSELSYETPAQARARYMAITLSNRGVLNAVKGDLNAARADFDAALAQQARVSSVRTNIEKLKTAEDPA
jgi:hypothetical protein